MLFLCRFFRDVKQQVFADGVAPSSLGGEGASGSAAEAASPLVGRWRNSWSKPRETNGNPSVALLRSRSPIELITISRSGAFSISGMRRVHDHEQRIRDLDAILFPRLKNGGRYPDAKRILAGQDFLLGSTWAAQRKFSSRCIARREQEKPCWEYLETRAKKILEYPVECKDCKVFKQYHGRPDRI